MKLLIVTQKVDSSDGVLGFMHGWIRAFAARVESVVVICLYEGVHDLPPNVRVLSLGKEAGQSRLKYIARFYSYIWRYRHEYDAVFVHMNQVYVVLGGPFWRLQRKYIALWYAHGHLARGLRLAERFANAIFTSTAGGFRLPSRKVKVVGQGIDTQVFAPQANRSRESALQTVTVGRISRSKNYEQLLAALSILRTQGAPFRVSIIGAPITAQDEEYLGELKENISRDGLETHVSFEGPLPNQAIVPHLKQAGLFVNMGKTGSLDKAILEAMACGLPILTCNEALYEILGPDLSTRLIFPKDDSHALAQRMTWVMGMPVAERVALGMRLREIVVEEHDLSRLVDTIVAIVEKGSGRGASSRRGGGVPRRRRGRSR
jgi:glycosyltransferase involved in cell wall biosynthesis